MGALVLSPFVCVQASVGWSGLCRRTCDCVCVLEAVQVGSGPACGKQHDCHSRPVGGARLL